jgi:hypothetical protein
VKIFKLLSEVKKIDEIVLSLKQLNLWGKRLQFQPRMSEASNMRRTTHKSSYVCYSYMCKKKMNGDYPLLREALVPLRAQLLPTDIHPEVPGVSQSVPLYMYRQCR